MQDSTPYPPMPTKSPNTVHWTTQWDFSALIKDEDKQQEQINLMEQRDRQKLLWDIIKRT